MSETLPHPPASRPRQLQIRERRTLLMVGDNLAIGLAVLLSLWVWVTVDGRGLGWSFVLRRVYWYPLLGALWFVLAYANDFYNLRISTRFETSLLRLVQIKLQLLILYLGIFFISPPGALPRLFILYYGTLSFVLILLWRTARPVSVPPRRALILGAGAAAQALLEALNTYAPDEYLIVSIIGNDDGDIHLLALTRRERITEIVLANEGEIPDTLMQAVLDCYEQGVSVVPMPLLYEQITGSVPIEHLSREYWPTILPVEGTPAFSLFPIVKRGIDIAAALTGLALFLPLLPLIALAQRLNSPGPIFFRQERLGQGGTPFSLLKLRTMVPNAEATTGPQWSTAGDPRITRTGRWLRRTRLDEVPQLMNVLRGEMSLIGPRPERAAFVHELSRSIPFYRARHVVKPGITGWAQVNYGYGSSVQDALIKLQFDLYYIRHQSVGLDLLIMLRTVGRMIALKGR